MLGGILGFLGVAFGAFGAHALRARLSPEMLAVFERCAVSDVPHACGAARGSCNRAHRQCAPARRSGVVFLRRGPVIFRESLRSGADRRDEPGSHYADRGPAVSNRLGLSRSFRDCQIGSDPTLRPSPGATRHPLPVGEGHLQSFPLPLGEWRVAPGEGRRTTKKLRLVEIEQLHFKA